MAFLCLFCIIVGPVPYNIKHLQVGVGDISNILDELLVFTCTMVNGYDKAILSINCHRNIKLSAYEVFSLPHAAKALLLRYYSYF